MHTAFEDFFLYTLKRTKIILCSNHHNGITANDINLINQPKKEYFRIYCKKIKLHVEIPTSFML